MSRCRAGTLKLGLLLALAGGCATAPSDDRHSVHVKWEVSLDDSCGKLAAALALTDLFEVRESMRRGEYDKVAASLEAELEKRCPDNVDVDLDGLEPSIGVPVMACAELRGLVAMADAFGMMATLPQRKREIANKLMDAFESELEKRCPVLE